MYIVLINGEKAATFSDKMTARRYARMNESINKVITIKYENSN